MAKWITIALSVLTGTAAIAACGSSSTPSSTTAAASASYNANVKVAQCMRSHGVSSFPDPTAVAAGQGPGGFSIQSDVNGTSEITVNGVSVDGLAYKSAATICHLAAAVGVGRTLTGAQEQGMIAKAHCLRTHGVPDFPDPSFGPGGRGIRFQPPAGYNPQSPAVRQAAKACVAVGTTIPGAGAKG